MKRIINKILLSLVFVLTIGILGANFSNANISMSFAYENPGDFPTYKINPKTKPYKNKYTKRGTYNEYTDQYYMLRSYFEQLEKSGGGTLVLDSGKYVITNVLYVPANTTVIFNDGVLIKKGRFTGTGYLNPARSIFQLIRPSAAKEKEIYGEHNGEHDINFIGIGNATIDLDYHPYSLAIVMAHNRNVRIEGINFKNYYIGHFIELDASQDVRIINNRFVGSKPSNTMYAEAINIDTPDYHTRGFNSKWSNHDKTPNDNVLIENNYFEDVDRAIGTHQYSDGKMHNDIKIIDNVIKKSRRDPIRIMNWSNTVISGNTIENVELEYKGLPVYGIYASGAVNPTIRNNVFSSLNRPMLFMPHQNVRTSDIYAMTYNNLNEKNKEDLKYNICNSTNEKMVYISTRFKEYDSDFEKIMIMN